MNTPLMECYLDLDTLIRKMEGLNVQGSEYRNRSLSLAITEAENAKFRLDRSIAEHQSSKGDGDTPKGALPGQTLVQVGIFLVLVAIAAAIWLSSR